MLTVEKDVRAGGLYTYDYLVQFPNMSLYQIMGTNRFMAIDGPVQPDRLQVRVKHQAKVPMYKQAIQMQMGRKPAKTHDAYRTYNLIRAEMIPNDFPRFEIYKVV